MSLHRTFNPQVEGSSPSVSTTSIPLEGVDSGVSGVDGATIGLSRATRSSTRQEKSGAMLDLATIIVFILGAIALFALTAPDSQAAHQHRPALWQHAIASYYGPGLEGNGLACGGTLTTHTRGVANKTLPCGTRLQLRFHHRIVNVRVIDRGPFVAGRSFDLTSATAHDLCQCRDFGVQQIKWRRV